MDILRGENTAHLKTVNRLEELYEEAAGKGYTPEFDRLLSNLPQEAFL